MVDRDVPPLDPSTARIAVVGPGGVGTFFAAQLAAAGRSVVACARRSFDRYVVDSTSVPLDIPATCVIDPSALPAVGLSAPAELVIVAVKGFQTEGAAPWLDALCGPDTIVVPAQNGVEEVERLTPFVNGALVVPCVVYCGTELLEPGHIRHDQHGILIVPDDETTRCIAPIFEGTGARWRPDPEFLTESWRKLGINAMVNGVTALTRRTMNVVGTESAGSVSRELYRECLRVGHAEGADVAEAEADSIDLSVFPDYGTSMYYDVMAGRRTEYDEIYGAVLRLGARHGLATPVTRVVHALLAGREAAPPPPAAETFGPDDAAST